MIIKNGTIHDAVNAQPYQADLALRDGVIAAIQLGAGTADEMYEHYCTLIDGLLA